MPRTQIGQGWISAVPTRPNRSRGLQHTLPLQAQLSKQRVFTQGVLNVPSGLLFTALQPHDLGLISKPDILQERNNLV